jgi:hypothetical protein
MATVPDIGMLEAEFLRYALGDQGLHLFGCFGAAFDAKKEEIARHIIISGGAAYPG